MGKKNMKNNKGLYETQFEHDNCGIGAVVSIKGRQSHKVVDDALKIVEKLEHRAGKDAEGKTGDGVGIMLQVSHTFFKKAAVTLTGLLIGLIHSHIIHTARYIIESVLMLLPLRSSTVITPIICSALIGPSTAV